jgi:hypothetical protein
MEEQLIYKLGVAHGIVKSETFGEGVIKSLTPYSYYIEIGITCLLTGIGVGLVVFSIIHYYKHVGKGKSVHTKKTKHKLFGKYNLHFLKRGKRYKLVFSGPPKQHSDLVLRE